MQDHVMFEFISCHLEFAKLLNSKHRVLDLTLDFQYITATYKVRSQGD